MDTIQYLNSDLRRAVDEDVVAVAKVGLGRFAVPRSVFCYVDHLGYLTYGLRGSTERAVRFIRQFFPSHYHDLAELIIHMWRHGVVHEHKPKSLSMTMPATGHNVKVLWLSTTHDQPRERGLHLLALPIKGRPNSVYLVVNNPQLGDDLIEAIHSLVHRLEGDASLKSSCDTRVADMGTSQPLSRVTNSDRRRAISDGMKKAWNERDGLIDEVGNVLNPHPKEPSTLASPNHGIE